jgi:hypothetical protein
MMTQFFKISKTVNDDDTVLGFEFRSLASLFQLVVIVEHLILCVLAILS